jgi:hypothetical protein
VKRIGVFTAGAAGLAGVVFAAEGSGLAEADTCGLRQATGNAATAQRNSALTGWERTLKHLIDARSSNTLMIALSLSRWLGDDAELDESATAKKEKRAPGGRASESSTSFVS